MQELYACIYLNNSHQVTLPTYIVNTYISWLAKKIVILECKEPPKFW